MTLLRPDYIYRLMPLSDWEAAVKTGALPWNDDDRRDGYLHLSRAAQVEETAQKYYQAFPALVAAGCVPPNDDERLKWEEARHGILFPHYYGDFLTGLITHCVELTKTGETFEQTEEIDQG